MAIIQTERSAIGDGVAVLSAIVFAAVGVAIGLNSPDPAMAFHGWVFTAGSAIAALYVLMTMGKPRNTDSSGYFDGPIRFGVIAAVIWGIAGFLVGDIIAWQLAFPVLNLDMPWTSFDRLRPLHLSAVIFAFGGNVLLATSF